MKDTSNSFAPIAIVGQSCVLPGALDPETFWENVREGRDLVTDVNAADWRLNDLNDVLINPASGNGADSSVRTDRAASARSGVVRGFADRLAGVLRSTDDASEIERLDVLFQWLLYCGRQALTDAGVARGDLLGRDDLRAGVIIGNLSYPTAKFSELYESILLEQAGVKNIVSGKPTPAATNRFMSGLPAHWLAEQLGCNSGAFALDAACASSLFALRLACDRLHDGTADLMLAGAVNAADDLFLHIGFTALQALSPAGMSRPFHREADGLVPAQGAALFVLKTLDRARQDGDRILGVIRGIGLSNDGRSRGFLAPAESGQAAAMRAAYAMSGLQPADISMIECHATGTAVGDATEIRSMSEIFAGCSNIPIGSLKSNLGHLITASGAAGLMKVLKSFEHTTRPATLHVDARQMLDQLTGSPFRVLSENEEYNTENQGLSSGDPRRAAVSSFGFGGNNGHLIVEEWLGASAPQYPVRAPDSSQASEAIAIVAMGAQVGELGDLNAFRSALFESRSEAGNSTGDIALNLKGLPFPPNDLNNTLGQQLVLLKVSAEALAELASPLDGDRTGVFVGMQCDTEIARYGLRWRLHDLLGAREYAESDLTIARDAIVPALDAPGVIGRMPNIPANRINACYDFRGPGFTVSAEELSGIRALEIAARALRKGELDAAIVGAVDLSREPVHTELAARIFAAEAAEASGEKIAGDAAIVFVCKRLSDAKADGDTIYALLEDAESDSTGSDRNSRGDNSRSVRFDTQTLFGHAHAASGLLELAGAVLAIRHGVRVAQSADGRKRAMPDPGAVLARSDEVILHGLGGQSTRVAIASREAREGYRSGDKSGIQVFSGRDADHILQLLESGASPNAETDLTAARELDRTIGPARLAIIVPHGQEAEFRERAIASLREVGRRSELLRDARLAPGIFFRSSPLAGELAFAFTGAASAYAGMGRELLLALPGLHERLAAKFSFQDLSRFVGWAYSGESSDSSAAATAFQQLCGSSYLCQIHAGLSRDLLGLKPHAVLGLSSGETNSLLAMDVWGDMETFLREIEASGMYDRELAGDFAAVQRYRARHELPGTDWSDWRLLAPVQTVRNCLEREPGVRLTIINTQDDCVIGGASDACQRVIDSIGRDLAIPLGHGMAVHCPEVGDFEETWHRLHHRATRAPADHVRFYSNHFDGGQYTPDADRAAQALTGNAMTTIDFPRIIERAYADGVRVFVEHGPRGLLSKWIGQILGDREHCAVSFDAPGDSLARTCEAVAQLIVYGVPVDYSEFALPVVSETSPVAGFMKSFPAHPEPVRIDSSVITGGHDTLPSFEPSAPDGYQHMEPAPLLASVASEPSVHSIRAGSIATSVAQLVSNQVINTQATVASGNGRDVVLQAFATQMAELTSHHTAFLQQQQTLHEQFLQLNRQLLSALPATGSQEFVEFHQQQGPREPRLNPAGDNYSISGPVAAPPSPESSLPSSKAPEPVKNLSGPIPTGVRVGREQLEIHAGGRISEIFGELFEQQDGYARQVRMPEPPLLLADRVTGLDAESGSMGLGTVWTETDVRSDAWYLNVGRMPAGIMIESGQADLFLISYLGVDFQNRGERVYRLLGCELTYRGRLPAVNDTLRYDIHVDGHAAQGDIRLFFFHYDCRVDDEIRLSVRNGQAGFFTDEELDDSGGILWDPLTGEYDARARLDSPAIESTRNAFSTEQLRAFSEGDLFACFGPGFEYGQTHVRPPKIQSGRMLFLDEVTEFDPRGGPWGRGYLRARSELSANDWFFDGHFKNDPCMPGTLMFEGCLQAMAFYLAGLGYTVSHDGWLFEPVPEEVYKLLCRGQATPASREIIYEVFVEEVHEGPMPTLFADLLCTIDGRKAFHARRMGLRLVPDWPLTSQPELLENYVDPVPVAQANGMPLGYASLLACAWGPPSDAFGEMYRRFDGPCTVPRLPGPPYHFMSRVTKTGSEVGDFREGARVEIEYDIPASDEWYFAEGVMPFAILLEAALQPCGWLASYVGSTLTTDDALFFRNLDGTAKLYADIAPRAGVLRTNVELTSISQTGSMIIQSFEVQSYLNNNLIYEMETVFGFFPAEALANQVGITVSDSERDLAFAPSEFFVDLGRRPARYFGQPLHLPDSMLCMLDRVTGYWPGDANTASDSIDSIEPTAAGVPVARLRGEKDVQASEWFFKAHFFQDPVQPGSLGLEALLQLLQFYMIHEGMDDGIAHPRFESIQLNEKIAWKYRGQVVPKNKLITSELEVLEIGRDVIGPFARAQGWLWVDGKRIYYFTDFGLRIIEDPDGPHKLKKSGQTEISAAKGEPGVECLDPEQDQWLRDHCPTYTVPVLPMMSVFDRLAGIARGSISNNVSNNTSKDLSSGDVNDPNAAIRVEDLVLNRWISFADGPRKLRSEIETLDPAATDDDAQSGTRLTRLSLWREAADARFSRFDPAATARVCPIGTGDGFARPEVLQPTDVMIAMQSPYQTGAMFHGPAFQYLRELREDASSAAASGLLDAGAGAVPFGNLHQGLLDAGTHLIPADRLHEWSREIDADQVAYPARIQRADIFEPLPHTGSVRIEVRLQGLVEFPETPGVRFPSFRLQWIMPGQTREADRVAIQMDLAYALFPKGPLGRAEPAKRRSFLRDQEYIEGVALSHFDVQSGETRLSYAEIQASDWLTGTVSAIYDCRAQNPENLTVEIAAKDHLARILKVHPARIKIDVDQATGFVDRLPYNPHSFQAQHTDGVAIVSSAGYPADSNSGALDADISQNIWRNMLSTGPWPGEPLIFGLIQKFVRKFVVEDPRDFKNLRGRGVLYLGNHQVGIESVLFAILAGGYAGVPLKTIAKMNHSESYIGRLIDCFMSYPGVHPPESIIFFDEQQPATFLDHLAGFKKSLETKQFSLMVHAEGSRAFSAHHRVEILSQVLVDFAIEMDFPIVPVWFGGGLPVEPQNDRIEFPCGFGAQDYYLGRSISPDELKDLNGARRVERVLAAINATGPAAGTERPNPPDPYFAERVAAVQVEAQIGEVAAVMRAMLETLPDPGPEIRQILAVLAREDATPAALASPEFRGDARRLAWMRKVAAYLTEV